MLNNCRHEEGSRVSLRYHIQREPFMSRSDHLMFKLGTVEYIYCLHHEFAMYYLAM